MVLWAEECHTITVKMPLPLVTPNLPQSVTAGTWKLKTGEICSVSIPKLCLNHLLMSLSVSFQGDVPFRPMPAMEPDLQTGKNEAILILSLLSKLTAPLCLELFFHTLFQS